MAQILFVKQKDGTSKTVKVLRAWIDINGQEVYLHANGRYARKDEQPLKSTADFNVIADKIQRDQAVRWWERSGKAESEAYFAAIDEKRREEAGDFRLAENDRTTLDAVLYTRRGAGKKKGAAVSAAKSWMEWFDKRPDWWGQARRIEFMDFVYELADEATAGDQDETVPGNASQTRPPGEMQAAAAPY